MDTHVKQQRPFAPVDRAYLNVINYSLEGKSFGGFYMPRSLLNESAGRAVITMNDETYMKLALDLAASADGQTSPNPLVGAVLVKNHQIVGMGAHLKAGTPHAEVHAVRMAGKEAEGAVAYVTLEPCSHYGKTPPCADLLIENGIRRVVIASVDPNPQVKGRGIEKLRAAGISVDIGVLKEKADSINRFFFHYMKTKTPYVTLKAAATLDGKTATYAGSSKWITGENARKDVHLNRMKHDAILVGAGTAAADDPSLNVRLEQAFRQPVRIVLDTSLRMLPTAKMLQDNGAPVWIVCTSQAEEKKKQELKAAGAEIIELADDTISISVLLKKLGEKNIQSLYVEGGSTVHGSFLEAAAFQELHYYIAPKLVGGKDAFPVFGGQGMELMENAAQLVIKSTETLGEDIKMTAFPKEG